MKKNKWSVWLLMGFGVLFGFAGLFFLTSNSGADKCVSSMWETFYYLLKKFIGFIGIIFSYYIFYEAGELKQRLQQ